MIVNGNRIARPASRVACMIRRRLRAPAAVAAAAAVVVALVISPKRTRTTMMAAWMIGRRWRMRWRPKSKPLEPPREDEAVARKGPPCQVENVKLQCGRAKAWRPDDALRLHSLPNLAKQLSLPSSGGKWYGGGAPWTLHSVASDPSEKCPLCTEDLDLTDTSFLPCLCGYKLCLFCHKQILEGDARCPNCRKSYENVVVKVEASVDVGSLTFRLPRSCSMVTRF